MIDYSKWKEKRINVSSLYLDHLNPRITTVDKGHTQNELINQMVKKYRVYELAKSIVHNGFFPDKNLIAYKEDSKYIVIEGNRRLAAVKALINPDIIESKDRKKFIELTRKVDSSYIKSLNTVITPSRENANPIIFKEHTSRSSMPWSRIMQAEFYVRQLNNGMSISDLGKEYHLSKREILKFLKLLSMYKIACSLNSLEADIREKVEDKEKFSKCASTLERVYEKRLMRNFLGISFTEEGVVEGRVAKDEFEKAYSKIIRDIVENKINTRVLNDDKKFKEYIDSTLKKYKPQNKGKFTQSDFISTKKEKESNEDTTITAKRTSTPVSRGIIPPGVPFKLKGSSNLQKFYKDLKGMPVKSYPNASGVTLRVFLDKSIRVYLKKKGLNKIEIKKKQIKESKKIEDISLGELIDYLISKDVDVIEDKNVKKVLKDFKNSDDKTSLSALNSLVHNEEYALNEKEVREIWTKLEGLFKIILLEPKR